MSYPPIIDGHQDFLSAGLKDKRDFLTENETGHVDLPRSIKGGVGAALAAIYLDNDQTEQNALGYAISQVNELLTIIDRSDGRMRQIRSSSDLDECLTTGTFGAILHLEGAEAISPSFKELRVLYEVGLRSIGPVWSRPNHFGAGVMFEGSQPTGGLTDAGFELVRRCNALGILLDVSHLNPAGFWDLSRTSSVPFVASHSNALAISPHVRNLDDIDQIRAIAEKDGTIGINLATGFLRRDASFDGDATLDEVMAHFEYIIALVGDRHVSFGTDYDGTGVPSLLKDVSTLPLIIDAMVARGWSDDRIERICNGNWRRVFRAVWR